MTVVEVCLKTELMEALSSLYLTEYLENKQTKPGQRTNRGVVKTKVFNGIDDAKGLG